MSLDDLDRTLAARSKEVAARDGGDDGWSAVYRNLDSMVADLDELVALEGKDNTQEGNHAV